MRSTGNLRAILGAAAVFGVIVVLAVDTPGVATGEPQKNNKAVEPQPGNDGKRVTVAEARARAKLMHDIYAATLDVMHHHFFRRERSVLPARALEDVFA